MEQRLSPPPAAPPPSIVGNMRPDVERLWRRFYPGHSDDAFPGRILALVEPDMEVLDIGAGSGIGLQARFPLKGRCRRFVGIDLDPRVRDNPHLDEAHVADACDLPFENNRFDLIYHTMVAEHLERPIDAFREMARVLKPGGEIHFNTPSRFYYPMLLARLTPTSMHSAMVKRLGSGRAEYEVFPTFYRMNTAGDIRRLAAAVGLVASIEHVSVPPGYLRFHPAPFLAGIAYERIMERLIPALRGQLWVRMSKAKTD